jgi:anti-sigma factor RsiW
MRHPDASLAAYVDGTATARERATAEAHLAACEACRRGVRRARAALKALTALPDLAAPHVDVAAVLQTVQARRAAARRSPAAATKTAAGATAPGDAAGVMSTQEWAPEAPGAPGDEASAGVVVAPGPTPEEGPPSATVTEFPGEEERARRKRDRDRAWQLRVAQFALGGAAILVAIVLFIGLRNDTGPQGTAARSGQQAIPSPPPGAVGEFAPTNFDETSLNNYAQTLVGQINQSKVVAHATATPAERDALASSGGTAPNASTADRQLSCIQQGTGLVAGNRLYQLLTATYLGQPAYIGAFLADVKSSSPTLLILVVSVNGCDNLRILRETLQPASP